MVRGGRTRAERDADVRLGEGRGVVDAVAHHRHHLAAGLQLLRGPPRLSVLVSVVRGGCLGVCFGGGRGVERNPAEELGAPIPPARLTAVALISGLRAFNVYSYRLRGLAIIRRAALPAGRRCGGGGQAAAGRGLREKPKIVGGLAFMRAAFPAGRFSAVTCWMASRDAMAAAVRRLSPVARWHVMPRRCSAATTPRASGFSGSNSAMVAARQPSRATMTHVCPSIWGGGEQGRAAWAAVAGANG